jgi:phospholipase/carboxylesterase
MRGDADPFMPQRLAEEVQLQLDPLHFLVTLDRFTGLRHGIDQCELDALGVALRSCVVAQASTTNVGFRLAAAVRI